MSDLAYIQLFIIFSSALIVTLVEILSKALNIKKDILPLLSITFGIIYSLGFSMSTGYFQDYPFISLVSGLALGMLGSGLYDNIKKGMKYFE